MEELTNHVAAKAIAEIASNILITRYSLNELTVASKGSAPINSQIEKALALSAEMYFRALQKVEKRIPPH